jgi:hypothetical protein
LSRRARFFLRDPVPVPGPENDGGLEPIPESPGKLEPDHVQIAYERFHRERFPKAQDLSADGGSEQSKTAAAEKFACNLYVPLRFAWPPSWSAIPFRLSDLLRFFISKRVIRA